MIKLRKFLAVIYFIAYVVLVGGWASVWFGIEPIASEINNRYGDLSLDYAVLVLLVITLIGALVILCRALSMRSKNTFQSSKNELGIIQVSRGAIVHEVETTVEAHESLKLLRTNVTIRNRRHPVSEIEVRIAPRLSMPMDKVSADLQREIKEAVEHLTGNEVKSVLIDVRKAMEIKEAPEEDDDTPLFGKLFKKDESEQTQKEKKPELEAEPEPELETIEAEAIEPSQE